MSQPQHLADPQAGVQQQTEQQPVPQVLAGIQDRLHLLGGQHLRSGARAPAR